MRVASIYLPNGNPIDDGQIPYKLAWMDRLTRMRASSWRSRSRFVLAGDYNVIPDAGRRQESRCMGERRAVPAGDPARFRELLYLGLTDAVRACDDSAGRYTFWDYQAGAWQKDNGIRIDHLLLSPQAAARLRRVGSTSMCARREKPSDHVPIRCDLDIDLR